MEDTKKLIEEARGMDRQGDFGAGVTSRIIRDLADALQREVARTEYHVKLCDERAADRGAPRARGGEVMKRKIYVASSWRCEAQGLVVAAIREAGHQVYDFKQPRPGDRGFHWSDIDPDWKAWKADAFREALEHPIAKRGYLSDYEAMDWADTFVLVQPCGRSAHLELGWAVGAGKGTIALLLDGQEPELMYRMVDRLCVNIAEALEILKKPKGAW